MWFDDPLNCCAEKRDPGMREQSIRARREKFGDNRAEISECQRATRETAGNPQRCGKNAGLGAKSS